MLVGWSHLTRTARLAKATAGVCTGFLDAVLPQDPGRHHLRDSQRAPRELPSCSDCRATRPSHGKARLLGQCPKCRTGVLVACSPVVSVAVHIRDANRITAATEGSRWSRSGH